MNLSRKLIGFLLITSFCIATWFLLLDGKKHFSQFSQKSKQSCIVDAQTPIIPNAWRESNLRAGNPLYEQLFSPKAKDRVLKADRVTFVPIFSTGELHEQLAALEANRMLIVKGHPGLDIKNIDWMQKRKGNYFSTQLHSFAGFAKVLSQEQKLSQVQELRITTVIRSWAVCNQEQPGLNSRAWFEGTVIKRLSNLLHVLNYFKRHGQMQGLQYEDLIYLILLQIDYLLNEPDIYSIGNHGIRQDMMLATSAIALPELLMADRMLALASKRLVESESVLFTKEGIWSEHAPGYVQYAIRLLMELRVLSEQSKKFNVDSLIRKIDSNKEYLIASLTPDMKIPWIGGSSATLMNPKVEAEITKNLPLASKLKDYKNSMRVYEDYGHAIMRGKDTQGPYLIFHAGHNPPAGKRHEDALSFIMYNHGRLWVTEGGHQTYEPGPITKYLRTAAAHNTYMYDNYQMNVNMSPRLSVGLSDYEDGDDFWRVSAFSDRFMNKARVERTIELDKAGAYMKIDDKFYQPQGRHECFQGALHFPPDLSVTMTDENALLVTSKLPAVSLTIWDQHKVMTNKTIRTGVRQPSISGWGFDGQKFGPVHTFAYEVCGTEKLSLKMQWH